MTRVDWMEPKDVPKPVRWFEPRRARGKKQTVQMKESGCAAKAVKLVVRSFFLLEEHASHDVNFSALCVIHVGGEIEQHGILAGSRRVEQILHHNQSASVMLNHAGQKQVIKCRAGGPFQGFHL